MSRVYLAVMQPRDAATGDIVTVRLSGGGDRGHTWLATTDWKLGLQAPPLAGANLGFDELGWTTGAVPAGLQLTWSPADIEDADAFADYFWKGAAVELYDFDETTGPGAGATYRVADAKPLRTQQTSAIVFDLIDAKLDLMKPLIAASFSGAGGIEGGDSLAGKPKRRAWGVVRNLELWSLDEANNIWVATDPAFKLQSFELVREMGLPASAIGVDWQGSVAATLAALAAYNLGDGTVHQTAVAPSIACLKWHSPNPGKLTADLRGEIGGGYSPKAADIAAAILAARNAGVTIEAASLAACQAERPDPTGLLVETQAETIAAALDRLLGGVSTWWAANGAGEIELGPWEWTDAAASYDGFDVARLMTFKPHHSRKIGYGRNHFQHSKGEVAGVILAVDVTGLGDLAVQDDVDFASQVGGAEKPEPNATVGAPTGTPVGDLVAEEVVDRLEVTEVVALDAEFAASIGVALDAAVGDNNKLSKAEKRRIVPKVDALANEVAALVANGIALGVTSEANALQAAWDGASGFLTYLQSLGGGPGTYAYRTYGSNTAMSGATYEARIVTLNSAIATLSAAAKARAATLATWGGTSDDGGRPVDYATRDAHIVNHNNSIIVGNSVEGGAGATGWTRSAYTIETYGGGAAIAARARDISSSQIFGLVGNITTTSFTDIAYGFYVLNTDVFIVESGVTIGQVASGAGLLTSLQIVYDDVAVNYFVDGGLVSSAIASPGLTFRGKFATYQPGAGFADIMFGKQASLDFASQGGSTKPADNADVTATSTYVSRLGPDGRILDGRALRSTQIAGVRSVQSAFVLSDAVYDASLATINIASGSFYTDWGGAVTYPSASFSATSAYNATSYWWRNHDDLSTGTGTGYDGSYSLADALGTGKVYLGGITTRASSGSGSGGTGGTGGGQWCVDAEAWVLMADGSERRARDIRAGDLIMVLAADGAGLEAAAVEANSLGVNDCVTIRTDSGARLSVSLNTPLTVEGQTGGDLPVAANAWAYRLPVAGAGGDVAWEGCRAGFRFVGRRRVARITVQGRTYGASMRRGGRKLFTHNSAQKP